MKKKTIRIPIYFGELILIKAKKWDKINKKYGYNLDNTFEAVVFKNVKKSGVTQYVVAFKGKPNGKVIAHETVHVVNHIFLDRYMELDAKNDEAQAYLTGFIFGEIEKYFKK